MSSDGRILVKDLRDRTVRMPYMRDLWDEVKRQRIAKGPQCQIRWTMYKAAQQCADCSLENNMSICITALVIMSMR